VNRDGRFDDAIAVLDKGQSLIGGTRRQTDGYGVAYALSGRRREAEAVLAELTERARTADQVAVSIAMVETALGHHDRRSLGSSAPTSSGRRRCSW